MPEYVVIESTETLEVGRHGGDLIAACECGGGLTVPDKGLGRATLAAWKTQHQHATDIAHGTAAGEVGP